MLRNLPIDLTLRHMVHEYRTRVGEHVVELILIERFGSVAQVQTPAMRQLNAVPDPPVQNVDGWAVGESLRERKQGVREVAGSAVALEIHQVLVDHEQIH